MASSYILPPDETITDRAARRKMAEALLAQSMEPQKIAHPLQGAAQMARALVGGLALRNVRNEAEQEGTDRRNALIGVLSRGASSPSPPPSPDAGSATPSATPTAADARMPPEIRNNAVNPTTASAGVPPVARALLDTIHGSESAYPGRDSYKVIYGGGEAKDFTDHPRQYVPIVSGPNKGLKTSAAGRYQYLYPSWVEAKTALNLPDFSPESQDKAAWWDAQRAYKKNTGRDLMTDLTEAGNDPQKLTSIGRGISTWWTSLPGGIEPNKATGSFGQRLAQRLMAAKTPTPAMPEGSVATASADPSFVPDIPMSPQPMAYARPDDPGATAAPAPAPTTRVAQAGSPNRQAIIQMLQSNNPTQRRIGEALAAKEVERQFSQRDLKPVDLGDRVGFTDQYGNIVRTEKKGAPPKEKKADAVKVIQGPTETLIVNPETGATIGRYPKDIAGATTAKEEAKAQAQAKTQFEAQGPSVTDAIAQTDAILKHPSLQSAVGPIAGRLPSITGGSRDFDERVEQLKGQAFLAARQALKGGGQITDFEGARAEAALVRASQAKSPADFKKALEEFKAYLSRGYDLLRKQAGATAPAAPSAASVPGGPPVNMKTKYGLE